MEVEIGGEDAGKIAILFCNLKGNIGDYAILQAMLKNLALVYPGRRLDIYSHPLLAVDETCLAEFNRQSPGSSMAGSTFTRNIPLYQRALVSSIFRKKMQCRIITSFARKASASMQHFSHYESIFFAGGDQWSGRELGVSMFGTLSSIHKYNRNLYAFPFSLKSSILDLYSRATLQDFFRKLQQPIIARDSLTHDILEKLEIPSVLGTDCVFSLQDCVADIPPALATEPGRTLFVVKGQEKNLSPVLERLLDQKSKVELLTTCKREDNRVYQNLADRFNLPYHKPTSWQEIIADFKASSLVVTNRLHGLILGSLAGTPLLPVADRKKSFAFVRDAGMPHFAQTADDISYSLIELTKSDRKFVLAKMKQYADANSLKPCCPVK